MGTDSISIEEAIETTVMGVREHVMGYYKSGCVSTVLGQSNIWSRVSGNREGRHYEQHQVRTKDPQKVGISDWAILTMEKAPNIVTLHLGTLDRSVTMRAIRQGIEDFLKRYLPYVEVATSDAGDRSAWRMDRGITLHNQIKPLSKENFSDMTPQEQTEYMVSLSPQGTGPEILPIYFDVGAITRPGIWTTDA